MSALWLPWWGWYNSCECQCLSKNMTRIGVEVDYDSIQMYMNVCSLLWPPCVAGADIIFLPCGFLLSFYLFSSPNLSGRRLDVYHTTTHAWFGLSANLECMSEMCCTRLAENTGRKNNAKTDDMGTIPQLCQAISSQLRHYRQSEKNLLDINIARTCPTIWWTSAH